MGALVGQVRLALPHLPVPKLFAQIALGRLQLTLLRLKLGHARLGGVDIGGEGGDLPGETAGNRLLRLDDSSRLGLVGSQ